MPGILHLRTASGPVAASPATVRELLASGGLRPDQRAVSADGGASWTDAATALATATADVVPGAALAAARAASGEGLHPLAVPLAGVAVATLAAAIAFGGGTAPSLASLPAMACAGGRAGVDGAVATVAAIGDHAAGLAGAVWAVVAPPQPATGAHPGTGMAAPGPATGDAPAIPAEQPATPDGDLLTAWRDFLHQGATSPAGTWRARADALAEQTTRLGIAGWPVRLAAAVPVSEADRERVSALYPGVADAALEAIFDVPGGDALAISGVVSDPASARAIAAMPVGKALRLTATCLAAHADPDKRTVDLIVRVTAAE